MHVDQNVQRVLLDELTSRLDIVAHQDVEQVMSSTGIFDGHLQQMSTRRIHTRVPKFLGVHFTQPLEPGDLQALLTQRPDR